MVRSSDPKPDEEELYKNRYITQHRQKTSLTDIYNTTWAKNVTHRYITQHRQKTLLTDIYNTTSAKNVTHRYI